MYALKEGDVVWLNDDLKVNSIKPKNSSVACAVSNDHEIIEPQPDEMYMGNLEHANYIKFKGESNWEFNTKDITLKVEEGIITITGGEVKIGEGAKLALNEDAEIVIPEQTVVVAANGGVKNTTSIACSIRGAGQSKTKI